VKLASVATVIGRVGNFIIELTAKEVIISIFSISLNPLLLLIDPASTFILAMLISEGVSTEVIRIPQIYRIVVSNCGTTITVFA
jgi:hypothetical protein